MSAPKHSPLPWRLADEEYVGILDAEGNHVTDVCGEDVCKSLDARHAALIVRAVNAHDKLAAALERLLAGAPGSVAAHDPGCGCMIHEAIAALARAKGEQP